ncbi:MAG: RNA methyltransferase [Lachnospiraceae bacterium]|nr:RNA methyltransferase [Lachnospiraceae bacterium]
MITSVNNEKIRHVAALQKKAALRRQEGVFLAEGVRLFEEIAFDRIKEAYLTKEGAAQLRMRGHIDIDALFERGKAEYVSEEAFAKMSDVVTPQGALAVAERFGYTMKDMVNEDRAPLIMMAVDVQDPGNLGTIFRTAEAAGADGMVICGSCADVYSPKVVRSTMGAIMRLPFIIEEDGLKAIKMLQDMGVKVYAAALDDKAKTFSENDYTGPAAFMTGNEGNGLKEEHILAADGTVFIPMAGRTESLNASISAALLLYEAARQRGYKR